MSKKTRNNQSPKLNELTQTTQAQYPVAGQQFGFAFQQTRTIFDPAVVKAYAEMVPDAPERILSEFQSNGVTARQSQVAQDERQHLAIEKQAKDNARRDWMAFILILALMGLAGVFAWLKETYLAGGTIIGLIGYVTLGFFKWRK